MKNGPYSHTSIGSIKITPNLYRHIQPVSEHESHLQRWRLQIFRTEPSKSEIGIHIVHINRRSFSTVPSHLISWITPLAITTTRLAACSIRCSVWPIMKFFNNFRPFTIISVEEELPTCHCHNEDISIASSDNSSAQCSSTRSTENSFHPPS